MKTIYFIIFLFIGNSLFAQDCNVSVSTTKDNSVFCCHELNIINNSIESFAAIRLRPITNLDFTNVTINPGWNLSNGGPAEILFSSAGGLIPTGTASPLSFCINDIGSAPQLIRAQWLNTMGDPICESIIELSCPRCMIIDHEELLCENGGYRFNFDVTNVFDQTITQLVAVPINPIPNSIIPPSIAVNIPSGSTSAGHNFWFDLPAGSGTFEFLVQAVCPINCNCPSDTIRIDIPDCCSDPCTDVSVILHSETDPSEYCCWSLDLNGVCDTTFFKGIKIEVPASMYMNDQRAAFGWYIDQPSNNSAIWRPAAFNNNGCIGSGPIQDKIFFCLSGIHDPSQFPQDITISWLDGNDVTACDTVVQTLCDTLVRGDCVIVKDDTITCDENGLYKFNWSLENVGNFTAANIYINSLYTIPSGGNVIWNTPLPLTGLNFGPTDVLVMPEALISGLNPGEQFCFTLSLTDNISPDGVQQCCHTDFLCFTMPECPPDPIDCEVPCSGLYVNTTQQDPDSSYCCHELELAVSCDTTYMAVCLETLDGVQFDRLSVPFNYTVTNLSASKKIIKPAAFSPGAPFFVPGDTLRSINYCLSGIHDMTQVPQRFVLSWLDINGNKLCSDTIIYECPPTPPGNCIVILNDTIKCDPPGHYAFCFDIINAGQFTGKYIRVHDMYTRPSGGIMSPPQFDTVTTFAVGDTFSVPAIHINGSEPGDTLCYVVSIFDDPAPSGYNNCCHTDTLCIVLPDCGDETVCDSVSWDTLSTQGECCFTLEINNRFSPTYFNALKLTALNPGVIIATASTYPDWQVTPCPGGYLIEYTGVGAPNIPAGVSVPIDFCVSGYTSPTQTLELTWLKPGPNGELIVECCQGLILNCPPPAPDIPCFEISNMSSTCVDDSLKFHFKLMNNTNIGATSPGYPINRLTFNVLYPSGANFVPGPIPISPPLNAGAMRMFTVDLTGVGQGQAIHFTAGVHLVNDSTIECCVSDSSYCFTTAECDSTVFTMCDTNVIDSIPFEGWALVTCGPTTTTPLSEYVLGLIDIRNHENAPRNTDWGTAATPPTMLHGLNGNDWDYQTLGRIFGLAINNNDAKAYTSATAFYQVAGKYWGTAGQPAIYEIDLLSGVVSTLITTTNSSVSVSPGPFNAATQIPNSIDAATQAAPAFGNIAFNHQSNILYAANLEDGIIYAVDVLTGQVVSGLDPWNVDSRNAGAEILGERVFAVQYHQQQNKVYFSRVANESGPSGSASIGQEIWSATLTSDGKFQTGSTSYQLEFVVQDYQTAPPYYIRNYSYPITDISFSIDGAKMLLAERGHPHASRLLEYQLNAGAWIAEPLQKYRIGVYINNQDNSAGGSDFAYTRPRDFTLPCDTNILDSTALCTGNALQFGPNFIYGLQGTSIEGGTIDQSFLIDFDGVSSGAAKNDIGDVEVFRNMCCGFVQEIDTCCQDKEYFDIQIYQATFINQLSDSSVEVTNPLLTSCHLMTIDWGDGNIEHDLTVSQLPKTHYYNGVDTTYEVCITLFEVAADGTICFESIAPYCEEVDVDTLVASHNIELSNAIHVYPNPCSQTFELTTSWGQSLEWVRVYNLYGKQVYNQSLSSQRTILNTADWSAGIYIIEVIDSDGDIGRKQIVRQ